MREFNVTTEEQLASSYIQNTLAKYSDPSIAWGQVISWVRNDIQFNALMNSKIPTIELVQNIREMRYWDKRFIVKLIQQKGRDFVDPLVAAAEDKTLKLSGISSNENTWLFCLNTFSSLIVSKELAKHTTHGLATNIKGQPFYTTHLSCANAHRFCSLLLETPKTMKETQDVVYNLTAQFYLWCGDDFTIGYYTDELKKFQKGIVKMSQKLPHSSWEELEKRWQKDLAESGRDKVSFKAAIAFDIDEAVTKRASKERSVEKKTPDPTAEMEMMEQRKVELKTHGIKRFFKRYSITQDSLQMIIDSGLNLNTPVSGSSTMLIHMLRKDNVGYAKMLIQAGVDLQYKNKAGEYALSMVVKNRRPELLTEMINMGFDPWKTPGPSEIHPFFCAMTFDKECALIFLNHPSATPHITDDQGRNAFFHLIPRYLGRRNEANRILTVFKELLNKGVDPLQPDVDGVTLKEYIKYDVHDSSVATLKNALIGILEEYEVYKTAVLLDGIVEEASQSRDAVVKKRKM